MTQRFRTQETECWRFDRYELKHGKIVPAPGAAGGPYDPWQIYETRKTETKGNSPYTELFTLLERLGLTAPFDFDELLVTEAAVPLETVQHFTNAQVTTILGACRR